MVGKMLDNLSVREKFDGSEGDEENE